MAGFIHTGGVNLPMPFITSLDDKSQLGILDSIVNDLGGTNGDLPNSGQVPGPLVGQFQIYDDMRLFGTPRATGTAGTLQVQGVGSVSVTRRAVPCTAGNRAGESAAYITNNANFQFDTATGKVKPGTGNNIWSQCMNWDASPGTILGPSSTVTTGRWYEVTAACTPETTAGTMTVTPVVTVADPLGQAYRLCRAIVIKCNSPSHPFYVLLEEYGNAAIGLRATVYESWNNQTHTGTNGSATEWMRLYENTGFAGNYFMITAANNVRNIKTTKCQYVLSLKDDFFALWIGADPAQGTYNTAMFQGDIVVVCNIAPTRAYDTAVTAFIPSNTTHSGRWVAGYPTTQSMGAIQMIKNTLGTYWQDGYAPWPKSMPFWHDTSRASLDIDSAYPFCDIEVFQTSKSGAVQFATGQEMKRGDIPWLRFPVGGFSHLGQFSVVNPDSSIDTYISFVIPFPVIDTANVGASNYTLWNGGLNYAFGPGQSALCYALRCDAYSGSVAQTITPRGCLVPVS